MQVGQIHNNHVVQRSDDSTKTAQHVVLSEESKAMVKENSTNITFEMGSLKLQMHKQNRTEFQKTNSNKDTETYSKLQQSMIAEKREHNAQVADMSAAQRKVSNLFKPQSAPRQHINFLA